MAIVTLNKKQFEKEIGKFDDKMEEKIALFGTPIDKVTNEELQIEIFPNRPDLLSYHGFKRAFLAFLEKKTGLVQYKINKSNYKVIVDPSLKDIRPYTTCVVIKDIKLDSEKIKELIEIQEKLHLTLGRKRRKLAMGIYPLEKIKFPITFKALEPDKIKFIPLESDKEMSGLEILQKHPTGKEYASLLSGKAKFPIFIDSEDKILSMPPIINSKTTGRVTEKTKDIFVECSGFDPNILEKCLNILVAALADMGGEIYEVEVSYGKDKKIFPNFETEKRPISIENVNKLLGLDLKENDVKKLLEKMGYNSNKNIVEIPPWRIDILHEVDLIEDVAIAYGYEKLIPEIPEISTIGQEDPKEVIKRKISEILTGLDMQEISNYHLTTLKDQFEKMGINEKSKYIPVENSKTDYNILRENLTHYSLKTFSENIKNDFPQRIFEVGKIFKYGENIKEENSLSIATSPNNFTEIKQILNYLSKMLDLKISFREPKEFPNYFIEGRVAEIILEDEKIGFAGEIHPKILKNWKIRMPVALSEINLDKIIKKLNN
ncbi:MAG: phenylalanine--tRNA ligase subunit beta [Candidatus Nanoarchaeia archaeon]